MSVCELLDIRCVRCRAVLAHPPKSLTTIPIISSHPLYRPHIHSAIARPIHPRNHHSPPPNHSFETDPSQRKARVALGREQTDKGVISRFSAKLGEALGRIDPKVCRGEGGLWVCVVREGVVFV